jgi:hypothetical protein
MLTDLPDWAQPGCFGQALTYSETHSECRSCPFAQSCKPAHLEALARLRDQHGIVVQRKGERRVKERAVTPGASGFAVPKKVDELLVRIAAAGIRVAESLAAGKNPFSGQHRSVRYMRIASHFLLRAPAGFSREKLITALQQDLNWSKGTAAAHATQAFQALKALGVAEEQNGRLFLKR